NGVRTETPINYDARDLVTHAVCVGMTGSGKTGLCIGLLEEAALDKVPAILIDPKGDITNLLLQFPDLRPEDFQPWVNVDDARRKEKTVEEFAAAIAETWRNGLADWGITGDRMRLLASHTRYTIFTPGSEMGVPLNIMGSLAAPQLDWAAESEAIRERITGTVAALLGLAGVNTDPVRGREGILLANIFEHFWQQGKNLDLETLINSITNPPIKKLGAFEVDVFYPSKDRFDLAMKFNALLASPKFQSWLQGEPLDVDRLLYSADGQPRHSVVYIAHLSDSERMFIVTLLLENVLTWMRKQSGTTSLRALLYFDEVFGYFPPTAEPPSKRPLLTLLKQARAFGLGVVLVTQNPVDIDYKGLTNAGTWFIGKLQAERDKERVLAGLKGALSEAGKSEATDYSRLITKLGNRVFLMHNVNDNGPVVFHTRWAMSYLRGPLTLPQVRSLVGAPSSPPATTTPVAPASPSAEPAPAVTIPSPASVPPPAQSDHQSAPPGFLPTQPTIPPDIKQAYLPCCIDDRQAIRLAGDQAGERVSVKDVQLLYDAGLLGVAAVRFVDHR
ncbi:MAG: ATP-binding protein, partial [Caldilinea sp.]